MALAIDQDTIVSRLSDLRARRPALALRAARGDDDARRELAAVDADARAYESDIELLALAGAEERRLATVQAARDAAEERARLEVAFAEREAEVTGAYREIEATIAAFVAQAKAAEVVAVELDRLDVALGRPARACRIRARQGIVGRVADAVWSRIGWPFMLPAMPTAPLVDDDGGAS